MIDRAAGTATSASNLASRAVVFDEVGCQCVIDRWESLSRYPGVFWALSPSTHSPMYPFAPGVPPGVPWSLAVAAWPTLPGPPLPKLLRCTDRSSRSTDGRSRSSSRLTTSRASYISSARLPGWRAWSSSASNARARACVVVMPGLRAIATLCPARLVPPRGTLPRPGSPGRFSQPGQHIQPLVCVP